MKTLKFHYSLEISFDRPVRNHRFTVKCTPKSDDRQTISNVKLVINPGDNLTQTVDTFQNVCVIGNMEAPHSQFTVDLTGTAITGLSDCCRTHAPHRIIMFKNQSAYTKPGDHIRSLNAELDLSATDSNLIKSLKIMQAVRSRISYVSGSTSILTSAEEALTQGSGVCQDYSHIMLSLCRMRGIPARYVLGMLIGEGYSHAWVEIEQDGYWYGIDPTNDKMATDEHIKISHGRDYNDCLLNQGLFVGSCQQELKCSVIVEEVPSANSG